MRIASRLLGSAGCYGLGPVTDRASMGPKPIQLDDPVIRDCPTACTPLTSHDASSRGLWKSAKREKPTPRTTVAGRGVWAIRLGSTGVELVVVSHLGQKVRNAGRTRAVQASNHRSALALDHRVARHAVNARSHSLTKPIVTVRVDVEVLLSGWYLCIDS